MGMRSELRKGILALILLSFIYSCMGIFVRGLGSEFGVFQQVYVRVLGAFLVGVLFFWKKIDFKKIVTISLQDWSVIALRAAAFAFGVVFFTLAFLSEDTSYSNATFIQVFPLLPIFGYVFLRERLTLVQILWILVGFVGVGCIAISDVTQLLHWGKGEVYALLCAIAFDISYVAQKFQSEYLNSQETVVLIFAIEGLLVLLGSFFFVEPALQLSHVLQPLVLFNIGLSSVFNVCNLLLINYGFKRVPVSVGGNILILETFFALIIGIFLYTELPTARELFGGLLIIASVYGINSSAPNEDTADQ